jgi:hypothetical protein
MKIGRNDPCPCASGKKYKKCCLAKDEAREREEQTMLVGGHRPPASGKPLTLRPPAARPGSFADFLLRLLAGHGRAETQQARSVSGAA